LTKKKCKEALEQLDLNCWGCEYACDMSDDKPCVLKEIIGKLIDEHFDNPPLKFEELEEGMVVWDNLEKNYIEICDSFNGQKIYYKFGINIPYIFMFQENRFYRRQVE
jgi:hypothetical protein